MKEKVFILPVENYQNLSVDSLYQAINHFPEIQNCKNKTILLKPNLIEFNPDLPVNTDSSFISKVIELFQELGASRIIVGEGPGHRADTFHLLQETGLGKVIENKKVKFLDLNRCCIQAIPNSGKFSDFSQFYLGGTRPDVDIKVSLPKLKTHHFAGLTCALKNLLGTAAGTVYGWPKNPFHMFGLDKSIADLFLAYKPDFTIVDGISAMEGNGPLHGEPVPLGLVIMGDCLPSVDATCAELIGLNPWGIPYLRLLEKKKFVIDRELIQQVGEPIDHWKREFKILPSMEIFRQ